MRFKFISFCIAVVLVMSCFLSDSSADQRVRAPFIDPIQTDDTSGAPDAFGYTWKDSQEPGVTYNFLDTTYGSGTWTQISGLGDDNFVGPFTLGFDFRYYYYNVNKLWIGSNGYIMFGPTGLMASPFPNIPVTAVPNNMIAGLGSDLSFDGAGNPGTCYMYTNNADTVIVSYYGVPFWAQATPPYTGSNTFQIILAASDSSITIQYATQTGVTNNNDITTGIEDISGQVGLPYLRNVYPTPNRAVKFFYPDTVTFQVTDAAVNWIDNPANGAIFTTEGTSVQVRTNIGNIGNQSTPMFNSIVRVRQGTTTLQTDTIVVPAMTPGQDTVLLSPNTWTAGTPGRYEVTVTNTLIDDVTINNFRSFEIVVLKADSISQDMAYDDGTSESTISWSGGSGSVAQYFIPPAYPVDITAIKFFIATTGPGFDGRILDDDGPNGGPGTQLFTQLSSNPAAGSFTTIPVSPAVTINDGGFYVVWTMQGANIALGEDLSIPVSQRSFEGFGSIFAPYRNNATQDPMIRATVNLPSTVGIINTSNTIPDVYSLQQNYPNPFNPSTKINFSIPKAGITKITVFDILGREISSLVNESLTAGSYVVDFNGAGLNSGIYFYTLESNGYRETRKMLLVK